jgi:hypothetical protein
MIQKINKKAENNASPYSTPKRRAVVDATVLCDAFGIAENKRADKLSSSLQLSKPPQRTVR